MADEQKPAAIPLGAQLMRKMYAGCKALTEGIDHGSLDECDAKTTINEHMKALSDCMGSMGKAFAKHYKGLDLESEEIADNEATNVQQDGDPETATPETSTPANGDPTPDPERQIKGDDEEEDGMDPTEKAMLTTRIKMVESKIRHAERLQRVARSRR